MPFNIDLLILTDKETQYLRPVKSLDMFINAQKQFHPDGLWSNEIFGVVGTNARSTRTSYIDLRVPIIHPTLCKTILKMRSFYKEILSGREFAKWDPELGDFIKSDMVDGKTGYEFFVTHLPKLNIPEKDSVTREQAIALFEKYKDNLLISKLLILPAGLRDLEIDEFGRVTSDDVNSLYYKLIAISNTINPSSVKASIEAYNPQRVSLQNTVNEIYEYFTQIVEGKKNLLMGKWAARKIFNGTRNVITSMIMHSTELTHPRNPTFNDTMMGVYQTAKAMLPVTIYNLKMGFLDKCFSSPGAPALLTDKETLRSIRTVLPAHIYTDWVSTEGLEKLLTHFKEESVRQEPVMVGDNYLGLIYRGPDGTFALIHGIDELPEGRNESDCTPITHMELLYCAIYHVAHNYPVYVTRYPITGVGSIYPSYVYLKSTVKFDERTELDPDTWEPYPDKRIAYQFPRRDSSSYNSLSPHASRIGRLGADFDGDTCSANIVTSDEALKEVKKYFNSPHAYVGTDGRFINDTNIDTVKFVLRNITGRKKYVDLPI